MGPVLLLFTTINWSHMWSVTKPDGECPLLNGSYESKQIESSSSLDNFMCFSLFFQSSFHLSLRISLNVVELDIGLLLPIEMNNSETSTNPTSIKTKRISFKYNLRRGLRCRTHLSISHKLISSNQYKATRRSLYYGSSPAIIYHYKLISYVIRNQTRWGVSPLEWFIWV